MSHIPWLRTPLLSLMAGALASILSIANAGSPESGKHAPSGIIGTWDVVHVRPDGHDQLRWLYRPDDFRLVGREVVIGAEALTINDGSAPCVLMKWRGTATSWARMLAATYPRVPQGGPPSKPLPEHFGLSIKSGTSATVHQPVCKADGEGRVPDPWVGASFVAQGKDTVFMNMRTLALLELKRRTPHATPEPSFECTKANSLAEKSICSSIGLAAWDKSVAAALADRLKRKPEERGALEVEQAEWLRARASCQQDARCLEDRMRERVEELVQGW